MADFDEITYDDGNPPSIHENCHDPVIIRGEGDITLFGINNRFRETFPPELTSHVAPEEFAYTVHAINHRLSASVPFSLRLFICACLCCCCTFGCSLWPVCCLSRRNLRSIQKFLEHENLRLYHRISMHVSLEKHRTPDSSFMMEYVLVFRFLPKPRICRPD